jgi:predicted regulator of Ras-like GTPase activity (Roadblock/LC7/MglB family)
MNQGLKEINELTGVWGSLLCNNQAGVIASAPPADFIGSALENIARHCVDLMSPGNESFQDLQEVVVHFQQKKLFILDLEQAILIVLCNPGVDISLLRMTINLMITRWEADRKIQKQLKANFVERI